MAPLAAPRLATLLPQRSPLSHTYQVSGMIQGMQPPMLLSIWLRMNGCVEH